jgi:3-hydroxyisobutyrate dehydrogenase-like beta-hydroxyacid dehydrogenase
MTSNTLERAGFIGLGFIGEPMAKRLPAAGFETWVHDLSADAVAALTNAGAKAGTSAADVARHTQIVGVCVVDDAQTESVVCGSDGILEGAEPGTIIALHGTIHPDTTKKLAAQAGVCGVRLIDAQMTGGPHGAAAGTLRYMVGGSDEDVARAQPFLKASGGEIIHCGPLGSGTVAKLANNLVQYSFWNALIEAQELTRSQGIDDAKLHEVLGWILGDSATLMIAGRNALEADPDNEFLAGRYAGVGRLLEKDLGLALEVAAAANLELPATKLTASSAATIFALPKPTS